MPRSANLLILLMTISFTSCIRQHILLLYRSYILSFLIRYVLHVHDQSIFVYIPPLYCASVTLQQTIKTHSGKDVSVVYRNVCVFDNVEGGKTGRRNLFVLFVNINENVLTAICSGERACV